MRTATNGTLFVTLCVVHGLLYRSSYVHGHTRLRTPTDLALAGLCPVIRPDARRGAVLSGDSLPVSDPVQNLTKIGRGSFQASLHHKFVSHTLLPYYWATTGKATGYGYVHLGSDPLRA